MSLVLHLLAVLFLWKSPLLLSAATPPPKVDMVRLVPADLSPAERRRLFTELPADRADEAPEKADLLSNVTSRARDMVPGGDSNLPSLRGESATPSVQQEPEQGASGNAGDSRPAASAGATSEAFGLTRASDRQSPGGRPFPPGAPGSSGVPQPDMDNPDGNAGLTGSVSLNTTAWDYAPWLQRFGDRLMDRWFPPTAYRMGLLKEGGWAEFDMEIAKNGQVLRLEQVGDEGHPSLTTAALSALRTMAPTEALPADFPEPTLILRVRMIYPKFRSR